MPRRKSLFGTIGWLRKKLYSGLNGLVPMSPRFEKRDSLRRFGELTLPCQVILISSLALEKFSLLLDQVVTSRRSLLPIPNKLQVEVWINWIFSCTLWVVFGLYISIDKLCQKHLASYRFVLKIPYRRGFLMFFFFPWFCCLPSKVLSRLANRKHFGFSTVPSSEKSFTKFTSLRQFSLRNTELRNLYRYYESEFIRIHLSVELRARLIRVYRKLNFSRNSSIDINPG